MKRSTKIILTFIILVTVSATTLITLGGCGVYALATYLSRQDSEIVVQGAHIWVSPEKNTAELRYFDADPSLAEGEKQVCRVPETVDYRGEQYSVTQIGYLGARDSYTIINGNAQIGELVVPSTVNSIELNAYSDIYSLEKITVDRSNANYYSHDGVLYSNTRDGSSNDLLYYPLGKKDASVELPKNFRNISDGSHIWGNVYLQNFTVEDGTKNFIAINGALYSPDGEVLMLYPVRKTDTTFIAPKEMRRIDLDSLFWDNVHIQNVAVESDSHYLKVEDNVLYSIDGSELLFRPKNGSKTFAIPSTVKVVSYNALLGLTHLYVPSSVVVFLDTFVGRSSNLVEISNIYFENDHLPKYLRDVKFSTWKVHFGYTREAFDQVISNL